MPRFRELPPESVTYKFGKAVRLARVTKGLTQRELARAAGVSKSTVTTCELAVGGTTLSVAYEFAQALGTTISDLTGENDA